MHAPSILGASDLYMCIRTHSKSEVDTFVARLDKTLKEFRKKVATMESKSGKEEFTPLDAAARVEEGGGTAR